MPLMIGLAGMDPATETALKSAFAEANEQLASRWRLVPEADAAYIIVDMDSMYGPMSWLRLHASGKRVVGLTSAPRAQTDFRLGRPFSAQGVGELLREIAREAGVELEAKGATAAAEAPPAATATRDVPAPAAATPAQAPAPPAPAATPEPAPPAPAKPTSGPAPVAAARTPEAPAIEPAIAEPAPAVVVPILVEKPPAQRTLFDWLAGQDLRGRVRYQRPAGPTLLIDADARSYHGPATLKPLAQYFDGPIERDAFATVDAASWDREATIAGAAQPLARLVWLGGLLAGRGQLLPGQDPDGRYQLTRWPQTEREYPRHFRIATAMMKGPATLAEIATASGIALDEICDFVNANLATGYAELVPETPPEPVEPARSSGLLGRLRRR